MATQFVNKHITRVLAAGGTIDDYTWLNSVDSWISGQGLYPHLADWTSGGFGIVKNGSNEISKVMGLGTTWLPRLGDLTPSSPTNTTYSSTAVSSRPGWVNSAHTAYSFYGSARAGSIRFENMRRKHYYGLTVVAVYKKSGTNTATFIGKGQGGGFYLQNTSGSNGVCRAFVGNLNPPPPSGGSLTADHGTTLTNNVTNIIGFTWDQQSGELTPYVEGNAGTTSTMSWGTGSVYDPCLGHSGIYSPFVHGSSWSRSQPDGAATPVIFSTNNESMFNCAELIWFYIRLTPTQMASLNTLLRTRY